MFSDTTYNAANYSEPFKYNATGTATGVSVFSAVPTSGLTFTMSTSGPSNTIAILHGLLNDTFVYDPATQGAITSIAASTSKTFTATSLDATTAMTFTYNNFFRPLIEQGGNFYSTNAPNIAAGTPLGPVAGGQTVTVGPQTISQAGLSANDFFLIDPSTGVITANHGLDFNGTPLTFGLVQLLASTGTPDTAMTRYADLSFSITSTAPTSPVPLPAGAPLFGAALLAFGAIGYGAKLRKRPAAV